MLPALKPLGYCATIICPCPSRLLKKAHLRRTDQVRLAPAPILRMGTRRAALHLDLFERPGRKRVFQHPARAAQRLFRIRRTGASRPSRTAVDEWRSACQLRESHQFLTVPHYRRKL